MRQNPHVRICGGPGSATTLVYPTGTQVAVAGVMRCDSGEKKHRSGAIEQV